MEWCVRRDHEEADTARTHGLLRAEQDIELGPLDVTQQQIDPLKNFRLETPVSSMKGRVLSRGRCGNFSPADAWMSR